MNGGENKIVTHSATQLPNGGKQPVSNKLVIAVVSLAILTFLGILSETSLNIAYSTPMEEFSIGASVVQWLVTGYLLLLSVSIPSSPFMVRKFATKTLFIMAIVIFTAGTMIMDVVFVALSGNVWVVAIAANDGADAAGSYMIAFPRSMMVFAGMAVLGVILASLMFRFSTRRPPEMREVK